MIEKTTNRTLKCSILALAVTLSAAGVVPALADCGFKNANWRAGEKIYSDTCIVCHGPDGRGLVPGAPDFMKKPSVLSVRPTNLVTERIEKGVHPPKPAMMAMPPKGGNPSLTHQDILNAQDYLYHAFGCR